MAEKENESELQFNEFKYYGDDEVRNQIDHKFSNQFDIALFISGLCSIGLPFYNVFVIYQNFLYYRTSFPDIYYQIVTYFEFVAINFLLVFGLLRVAYYWNASIGQRLYYFHRWIFNLQFNLFSLVPYLSLNGIYSLFAKARDRGEIQSERLIKPSRKESTYKIGFRTVKFLTTIFYLIFYAQLLLLITVSVLTKLSLVSFIGNIALENWSIDQFLTFFGIINNLSSLSRDDKVTLDFMWIIINDEWDPVELEWKRQKTCSFRVWRLYEMMYEVNRWKALMCIGTLSGRQLHDLVREP